MAPGISPPRVISGWALCRDLGAGRRAEAGLFAVLPHHGGGGDALRTQRASDFDLDSRHEEPRRSRHERRLFRRRRVSGGTQGASLATSLGQELLQMSEPEVRLEFLLPHEVRARLAARPFVYLPLGTIEW